MLNSLKWMAEVRPLEKRAEEEINRLLAHGSPETKRALGISRCLGILVVCSPSALKGLSEDEASVRQDCARMATKQLKMLLEDGK